MRPHVRAPLPGGGSCKSQRRGARRCIAAFECLCLLAGHAPPSIPPMQVCHAHSAPLPARPSKQSRTTRCSTGCARPTRTAGAALRPSCCAAWPSWASPPPTPTSSLLRSAPSLCGWTSTQVGALGQHGALPCCKQVCPLLRTGAMTFVPAHLPDCSAPLCRPCLSPTTQPVPSPAHLPTHPPIAVQPQSRGGVCWTPTTASCAPSPSGRAPQRRA